MKTDLELYQRLEANFAEPRDSAPLSLEHVASQSMDDEITLLGRGGIASSMEQMNIKETVSI